MIYLVLLFTSFISDGLGLSFSNVNVISTSIALPLNIVAADMDQDGDLDLLVCSRGRVDWLENTDSMGDFSVVHLVYSLSFFRSAIPADLNGDDRLDIVASRLNEVYWIKSAGAAGEFSSTLNVIDDSLSGATWSVAADVDSDGDLDVVAAGESADSVLLYKNNGTGVFDQLGTFLTQTEDQPLHLVAADIDGDEDLDIVSASGGTGVAWFQNSDGEGTFESGVSLGGPISGAHHVDAADIDGDGDVDLVASSDNDNIVYIYINSDGLGNFSTGISLGFIDSPINFKAADLDADGDLDLVGCSHGSGEIV